MVWLTIQMWGLLAAAYIFGIFSWWFLSRDRDEEIVYEGANVYDADDNDDHVKYDNHERSIENINDTTQSETVERQKFYESPPIADDSLDEGLETTSEKDDFNYISDLESLPNLKSDDLGASAPPLNATAPKLYSAPMQGPADDLKRVKGIGPTLERTLNATGIYYFDQIAEWTDEEIAWIDNRIDFQGRVTRERWVPQAIVLGAEENNGTSLKQENKTARDIETLTPQKEGSQPVKNEAAKEVPSKPFTPSTPSPSEASTESSSDAPESMLDKLMARKNEKS